MKICSFIVVCDNIPSFIINHQVTVEGTVNIKEIDRVIRELLRKRGPLPRVCKLYSMSLTECKLKLLFSWSFNVEVKKDVISEIEPIKDEDESCDSNTEVTDDSPTDVCI